MVDTQDYSTREKVLAEAKEFFLYWEEMWIYAKGYFGAFIPDDAWGEAVRWVRPEITQSEIMRGKDSLFPDSTQEEAKKILKELLGNVLDDEEIAALLKWRKKQIRKCQKWDKKHGGIEKQSERAWEVSECWPEKMREVVLEQMYFKMFHFNAIKPPVSRKSTTRQRAPRSHHRVAVSVRGGDSGDDESGESDPPAPPLFWRSCPYHRLPSHNPQLLEPLQLFPCGDVSRGRYRRRSFVVDSGRCAA